MKDFRENHKYILCSSDVYTSCLISQPLETFSSFRYIYISRYNYHLNSKKSLIICNVPAPEKARLFVSGLLNSMPQKNETPALIIAFLITAGLIGSGFWWFRQHEMGANQPGAPTATTAPTTSTAPSTATRLDASKPLTLASDRHVDYSQLQADLQKKDWQAADRETYLRLLDAAGPKAQALGFTPQDEMSTLSCTDLKTVDTLWSAASGGKFGFAAQQGILRALGDYRKLYDQVGWQKPSGEWLLEWTYNPQTKRMDYKPGKTPNFTDPPPGHFPTVERGYNFDVSLDGALKRCGF